MYIVDIIHWVRGVWKYMFEYPNYHVSGVYVNYTADMIMEQEEIENISGIWRDESYTWVGVNGRYFWDVTNDFKKTDGDNIPVIIMSAPPNVRDIVYTVKYCYNNKIYKYVSGSSTFIWPPVDNSMSFKMPILEAWCLNDDGKRVRNATKKLKKASGPVGNFHNQDVKIMDIVDYDYPKLEVKTLLNTTILDETDSVLKI